MTIAIMADIGGTHGRFACETPEGLHNIVKIPAATHGNFTDALAAYCDQHGYENKGDLYLAVAAHDDGQGNWRFTNNNPWVIRPAELERLGWHVRLIVMDFYASAVGALTLPPESLRVVKQGIASNLPKAILGPGTGLGLAYAFTLPDGKRHIQDTYGGFMLMAGVTDEHHELIRLIQRFKGPRSVVYCEDIVSGRGLPLLYRAVCERSGRQAVAGSSEILLGMADDVDVQETLRLFHEFLGIFAHHVVLTGHAFGGLYLDGGMIHRLCEMSLFNGDRMIDFMDLPGPSVVERDLGRVPVQIVTDPFVALRGLQEMKRNG